MERLRLCTGKSVSETLNFEGSIKELKDYVSAACEKYSPQDEVLIYGDIDGNVYMEVKEYNLEPASEYKQRVLNKIKELEEIIDLLEEN